MTVKVSGGTKEQGIVVGNVYDKYNSRNPLVRWIMQGFASTLDQLVAEISPGSIHEIGCGESYWTLRWNEQGIDARGSDFSHQVIEIAQENAAQQGLPPSIFEVRSIYELERRRDSADLVVCCEVLEHLERPELALQVLQKVVGRYLLSACPGSPYGGC